MYPTPKLYPYPNTLQEVEAADHVQICTWWRFLPSPSGHPHSPGDPDYLTTEYTQRILMGRIVDRFNALGGFTPEISKKINNSDPICGHCNKPFSKHERGNETYCYPESTGDLFSVEPTHEVIGLMLEDRHLDIYTALVAEWKKDNGHA